MVSSINTSGISVGSDGKLSVSGFSSGIDWKSLIDAQIAAKRAPAVQLETKISNNNTLVTAYGELKTKVADITTALDKLRGAPGSATDVFKTKTVSGTTAPSDAAPVNYTPSSIDSMVLVSVSNAAQAANHTIVVHQLAQAQQIRTGSVAATNTPLTGLGVTAGTFSINGKNVVVDSDDSLLDLKSKINNAGAGVTATIVSSDANTNYLVLTSNTTGAGVDNDITLGGDSATLSTLDLSADGGLTVAHELKPAKNAIVDVDGILGIERSSNQIDNIVDGVTFSLLKADANTEINLKVETDLSSVKTAIGNFVDAYNALRSYATDQRTAKDRNNDGKVDDGEVGPLAFDSTMRDVLAKLSDLVATSMNNNADGYKSLSQIGVVVNKDFSLSIDDSIMDNKLLTGADDVRKLFTLDVSTSDSRVSVQGRGAATVSGTYYLNVLATDGSGNILGGNISTTPGAGYSNTGSMNWSGKTITATSTTGANGMKLFFNSEANMGNTGDIAITVSRGLADQFYDYFNGMTSATSGQFDKLTTDLQAQNITFKDRVSTIDSRLEITRQTLTNQFVAMENALAQLQSVKDSITQYFDAANNSNN